MAPKIGPAPDTSLLLRPKAFIDAPQPEHHNTRISIK